jgi:YD repeat-containing protein
MARSTVDLMTVTLSLHDEPLGYSPPVGPPVRFWVRYHSRDPLQPANFSYSNFGPKWTCDWISYIIDNPQSLSADVTYYARGGGSRSFTGFDSGTQTFAYQQSDQTRLTRTGPASYEMLSPDGSKLIFSQSDGATGTSRKVFLTQVLDPFGNALTLTYDGSRRLVAITDAIGQVTTLSYEFPNDSLKITKVTDPFGRSATFDYEYAHSTYLAESLIRLTNITDVIGLSSKFGGFNDTPVGLGHIIFGDAIQQLVTPYGTNKFYLADDPDTTSVAETTYADGSRDRVEYNQGTNLYTADAAASVPAGMATYNGSLQYRNTYYWSRNACATGYGDYSKAKVYHWLHTTDLATTSDILESSKEALEGRVWYDYAGQPQPYIVGTTDKPTHVGRVLDDGSTQLYTYAYDSFGHVINSIDPVGRTFSYIYATNGIDLLEARQTRAGNNELLSRTTYNAHHLPLTTVNVAGQTNTYTYNSFGQLLTQTNPKNETTTYTYDTHGYLVTVDGPLPGTNDVATATYDSYGRTRTMTDVSGYRMILDYDDLDRITKITHPDSTFEQFTYNRLDPAIIQDRAGRQTLLEHDAIRQLTKRTDPVNRVTLFQWCSCGDIKSLTDPLGRTTTWHKDLQNRLVSKQYGDGSRVTYDYENTTSRPRQIIDEKLQVKQFTYNRDGTVSSIAYANTVVPTPGVSYTYDSNYQRVTSMTDGSGTTLYGYAPITGSFALDAGRLVSLDGPLSNDTITYAYDELGRRVSTSINGVVATVAFDALSRAASETNALGAFSYTFDGPSRRVVSETFPNGQINSRSYGGNLQDNLVQQITSQLGATQISQFTYGRDVPADRITTWSQQFGAQPALTDTFGYDAANQLLSGTVTNGGVLVNKFVYTYDRAGNRLVEQGGGLNQLGQLQPFEPTQHGHIREQLSHERMGRAGSPGRSQFRQPTYRIYLRRAKPAGLHPLSNQRNPGVPASARLV